MLSRGTLGPGIARAGFLLALAVACMNAAEPAADLRELMEQNRRLQEQVRAQQETIDELRAGMAGMARTSERHERELQGLQERMASPSPAPEGFSDRGREVRISGEAGLAFFKTGREGQFPSSSFRVDDPVIAIEAPVVRNTYFFTELKLLPREANTETFEIGELYLDFEDVSALWGQPGLLSFRAGRMNIPFGEEYQHRSPIQNPLISHSLADIWGVDEGVEIYGRIGRARYVIAVQNGGMLRLRDPNSDKAVAGRLSWQPVPWVHLSGSAMRTGNLDTVADNLSEVWFGGGFFRALGPAATTATFQADLLEGDATVRWNSGHASAALGGVRFRDSDTLANNARRITYGYVEMTQDIAERWFGAARYSEIRAPGGYPLPGWGRLGTYFFRPVLTTALRRTSVGLGYRIGPPIVVKVEVARESGRMTTGEGRDHENFFGSEIAVKF